MADRVRAICGLARYSVRGLSVGVRSPLQAIERERHARVDVRIERWSKITSCRDFVASSIYISTYAKYRYEVDVDH